VNGLKVTVWTFMIAALLIFEGGVKTLRELRGRKRRWDFQLEIIRKAQGGDQWFSATKPGGVRAAPVATHSARINHSQFNIPRKAQKKQALYLALFFSCDGRI
jgi:hypothetical protein